MSIRRRAIARIAALLLALPAGADTGTPRLTPLGTYYWSSPDPDLGGLSAILMQDAGDTLETVSDSGIFFRAAVERTRTGRISRLTIAERVHLRDGRDRPVQGFLEDAEALTIGQDGLTYIAFEGYTRIVGHDDIAAPPVRITHNAQRFRQYWHNTAFESLATLPDGRLLAVMEAPVVVGGGYKTFTHDGTSWVEGHPIPVYDGFRATGADVGPDGHLYLVERKWHYTAGFSTRIRRFETNSLTFTRGETLLTTHPGILENMEGISVWADRSGRTIISLISDDNHVPFLNSIIVEYLLDDSAPADDAGRANPRRAHPADDGRPPRDLP